jgi:aminoglycoside phosphotransferase (APT) family kinase protein
MQNSNKIFHINEDFENILKNALHCDFMSIQRIHTGWTNIVLDIKTQNCDFIARFPRGAHFSNAIEADVFATNFVRKNTDVKTIEALIYYDNSRPFSIHKKVHGEDLSKRLPYFTEKELDNLACDIAAFFSKIHEINHKTLPNRLNRRLSTFLRGVMSEVQSYEDYSDIDSLEYDEDRGLTVVHGDVNIGNIIVDKQNNIVAFLDFAFFGVSTVDADLARISCRVSDSLFDMMTYYYEKKTKTKLNAFTLSKCKRLWKNIEDHYISYMKKNMPDIQCNAV